MDHEGLLRHGVGNPEKQECDSGYCPLPEVYVIYTMVQNPAVLKYQDRIIT